MALWKYSDRRYAPRPESTGEQYLFGVLERFCGASADDFITDPKTQCVVGIVAHHAVTQHAAKMNLDPTKYNIIQ